MSAKIVALLSLSLSLSVASRSRIPVLISFSRFVLRALIFFGSFLFWLLFFREPAVLFSWLVAIFVALIIVLLIVVGLAQVFCSTSLCKTQPYLGSASRARHAL